MMEGCLQEDSTGGRAEGACWQAAGRALSPRRGLPRPKVGCKKTIPGPARRVTLTLAVSHSHHLRPGQVAPKITHRHGHLAHSFILAEAPLVVQQPGWKVILLHCTPGAMVFQEKEKGKTSPDTCKFSASRYHQGMPSLELVDRAHDGHGAVELSVYEVVFTRGAERAVVERHERPVERRGERAADARGAGGRGGRQRLSIY